MYMESKLIEYYCFIALFVMFATAKSEGASYKAFEELRVSIKCKVDGLGWREKKALGMTLDEGDVYKIGLPTNLIQDGGDQVSKHDCFVELRVMSNTSSKIIFQFRKSNKGMLSISSKETRDDLAHNQKFMPPLSPKHKESIASGAPPTSAYHLQSPFTFNKQFM